jgi:hypothetical protein
MKRKLAILSAVGICSAGLAHADSLCIDDPAFAERNPALCNALAAVESDYSKRAAAVPPEDHEAVKIRELYAKKKQDIFDSFVAKLRAQAAAKERTNGQCPAKGKLQIGMLKDEVRAAWCMPWSINTTETAKGIVSEQWVYESPPYTIGYLYFENGRLVAIQRRN